MQGCERVTAQLFLWPEDAKIVVADVEGVIYSTNTKKRANNEVSSSSKAPTGEPKASGWGSLFFSFGGGGSGANSSSALSKGGPHAGVTQVSQKYLQSRSI